MKKKSLALLATLALATNLTACGQYKGPCEVCGETKPLFELTLTSSASVFGSSISDSENYEVCKSCRNALINEADNYKSQFGESVTYTYEKMEK